ncbi:MAG: hypothetical protein ACKPKO_65180, partial [Candidatus Fonsibacter sp.]
IAWLAEVKRIEAKRARDRLVLVRINIAGQLDPPRRSTNWGGRPSRVRRAALGLLLEWVGTVLFTSKVA